MSAFALLRQREPQEVTQPTVVAVVGEDGRPQVLECQGERIVPSVVAVDVAFCR